ncbi:MAG: hypothetical protein ABIN66_07515 [candidate division WOR-3 bacterium]
MLSFVVLLSQWTVMPVAWDTAGDIGGYPSLDVTLGGDTIFFSYVGWDPVYSIWRLRLAVWLKPVDWMFVTKQDTILEGHTSVSYTRIGDTIVIGQSYQCKDSALPTTMLKYAQLALDGGAGIGESIVDTAGSTTGYYSSIAWDSQAKAHISYYSEADGDGELRYARWDGSSWQVEEIDTVGSVGYYTSLVLDALGRPHISCVFSGAYTAIKHAWWNGSAWQIERVDSGRFGMTSAGLDATGNPVIAYAHPAYGLWTAWWNGATWQKTLVDPSPCMDATLAMDTLGLPHIAYYDTLSGGNLKHAWYDGSWHTEVIVSGVGVWTTNPCGVMTNRAIRIDTLNCIHIVFYRRASLDPYYATTCWESLEAGKESPLSDEKVIAVGLSGVALFLAELETPLSIYRPDGRLAFSGFLKEGKNRIPLETGVYLWQARIYKGKVVVK